MTKLIGMTEAGDAGWDLSWYQTLQKDTYAGAILITKSVGRQEFKDAVLRFQKDVSKPFIIHADITGWGSTPMEPNVLPPETSIRAVRELIDSGIPSENFVLRVDPIIPTTEGIERAISVLKLRQQIIPDVSRIRISIYDDYRHSRAGMIDRGYQPVDNITKWKSETERRPTPDQIKLVGEALINVEPDIVFELCAEPELRQAYPDHFRWFGCLSKRDCKIMNVPVPDDIGVNGQNRFGCRCLKMKKELLTRKQRCPNNCAYCYWAR